MSNKSKPKKTIAIDIREACTKNPAGKGIYNLELARELVQDDDFEWVLVSDTAKLPESMLVFKKHFGIVVINQRGILWHFAVKKMLKDVDIYFSPTSYITPYLFRKTNVKTVVTVHDLIAFKFPDGVPAKAKIIERFLLPKIVKTVDGILSVSENTKIDLLELFPEVSKSKIVNTEIGTNAKTLADPFVRKKVILSVSSLLPRKNYLRLLQAFKLISHSIDHDLVIVGAAMSQKVKTELDNYIEKNRLKNRVKLVGYCTKEQLSELYSTSEIFVYPSLYEGFGMPILEAFAHNCPVTCSDSSSLPEVAGSAAIYFDPYDINEISRAIYELTQNQKLRTKLIKSGQDRVRDFTWKRTAQKTLELFKQF